MNLWPLGRKGHLVNGWRDGGGGMSSLKTHVKLCKPIVIPVPVVSNSILSHSRVSRLSAQLVNRL